MFDILADSALDIANGLIGEAWAGEAPSGGVDFPSSCTLSKCASGSHSSDFHLELEVVKDSSGLSEIPWLADVTRTEIQGPSDTNNPFVYPIGEAPPPGLFGSALKAYGEVVSMCIEFGADYKPYDEWFRSQWGIDKGTNLTHTVPQIRSHGVAFWGGVGRKLAPIPFAHLSASKQIKMVWHGVNRKKFGEHTLVDWPRLTALARLVGSAMMIEDRYAKGKVKRIDFRINPKELPVAPKGIGHGIEKVLAPATWETRNVCSVAIGYISSFYSRKIALIKGGLGSLSAVQIDSSDDLPTNSLVKFLKEEKTGMVPDILFMDMDEPVYDFIDKQPTRTMNLVKDQTVNVYHAFGAVVRPFVARNFFSLPAAHEIRILSDDVKWSTKREGVDQSFEILNIFRQTVPNDFLLRIFRMYCIIFRDKDKAGDVVVSLLKALNAPKSAFVTRDLVAIGTRVLNHQKSNRWMLEEVARAVSRHKIEHGKELRLTSKLKRILSSDDVTHLGISAIVTQRRNWWSLDYAKRARVEINFARKISLQLRSRLFKVLRIKITAENDAQPILDDPALSQVLYRSALAYARKRKGYNDAGMDIPDPQGISIRSYVRKLDDATQADVTWMSAFLGFERSASYLVEDVQRIMTFIVNDFRETFLKFQGDLLTDGELESEFNLLNDVEDAENETAGRTDGTPIISEDENLFSDDDDQVVNVKQAVKTDVLFEEDDFGDMTDVNKKKQMLVLYEELREDLPTLPESYLLTQAAKYDNRVSIDEYDNIRDMINKGFFDELDLKVPKGIEDDNEGQIDLKDRR